MLILGKKLNSSGFPSPSAINNNIFLLVAPIDNRADLLVEQQKINFTRRVKTFR